MKKKLLQVCFFLAAILLLILSSLSSFSPPHSSATSSKIRLGSVEQIPYSFLPLPAIADALTGTKETIVAVLNIAEGLQQIICLESNQNTEYPYSTYLSLGGHTYYLGSSLAPNLQLTQTPLTPLVDNSPIFMWFETYGAAYGCTGLMTIQKGTPVRLADIEGVVEFADLDGDGHKELITNGLSIAPQAVVYFLGPAQDGMERINVSQLLGATSLSFEKGKFVDRSNPFAIRSYIYRNGRFMLEQKCPVRED